jgi:hypothetical protein
VAWLNLAPMAGGGIKIASSAATGHMAFAIGRPKAPDRPGSVQIDS